MFKLFALILLVTVPKICSAQMAYVPFLDTSDRQNMTHNTVLAVDLQSGEVVKSITVGEKVGPVFLNQSGSRLYAASIAQNTVVEIDTRTLSVIRTWDNLPVAPEKLLLNETHQVLYFYQRYTDSIHQISIEDGLVSKNGVLPGLQQFWYSDNLHHLVTRQITSSGELISTFDLQNSALIDPQTAVKSFINSEDIRYDSTQIIVSGRRDGQLQDINFSLDNGIKIDNNGEQFYGTNTDITAFGNFDLNDGGLIWDSYYQLEFSSWIELNDKLTFASQIRIGDIEGVEYIFYFGIENIATVALNKLTGEPYHHDFTSTWSYLSEWFRDYYTDFYYKSLGELRDIHIGYPKFYLIPCHGTCPPRAFVYSKMQLIYTSGLEGIYGRVDQLGEGGTTAEGVLVGPNLFGSMASVPVPVISWAGYLVLMLLIGLMAWFSQSRFKNKLT